MISRGSTPTLTLGVFNMVGQTKQYVDLSAYDVLNLYLSESANDLKRDNCDVLLTIPKSRMTFNTQTNKFTVTLTQEETLKFTRNAIYYQIRGLNSGVELHTNIYATSIDMILGGGVL